MIDDHSLKWETVFDVLMCKDVMDVCNDDKYFIFQDIITNVADIFLRDPYVSTHCAV